MKFDPEKFGERVAVRVKQAMADAIRPLEARIAQLEADCAALLDILAETDAKSASAYLARNLSARKNGAADEAR